MQNVTNVKYLKIQPPTRRSSFEVQLLTQMDVLHLWLDDLCLLHTLPTHSPTHNEGRNRRPTREIKHSINRFIICQQHTRKQRFGDHSTECRSAGIDNSLGIYSRGEDGEFVGKRGGEDGLCEGEEKCGAEVLGLF